jgi:dTDP-glucose 4,6-dehydratase
VRILITGSRGTIGRSLVEELRRRGHEVWGCDLAHDSDARYVRADVGNIRQLEWAFHRAEPEVVYHLAAEFGRLNGEQFYEQLWRTAMVGTRNILEMCLQTGARLIFASSSEVYGETEVPMLDEGLTDREVIFHPNEYALSKWANERQIMAFEARNPELEAVRLRFFNAYGPGERFHAYRSVVALFCHKALNDEPLPVFRGYHRTFMYVDDFIPTLANVAEARELTHSVYNIGGEDYRPVEELAELVIEQAGSGSIEMIGEDRHNVRSKRPDNHRAIRDLDHRPATKLEDGVPPTLAWLGLQEELCLPR